MLLNKRIIEQATILDCFDYAAHAYNVIGQMWACQT